MQVTPSRVPLVWQWRKYSRKSRSCQTSLPGTCAKHIFLIHTLILVVVAPRSFMLPSTLFAQSPPSHPTSWTSEARDS